MPLPPATARALPTGVLANRVTGSAVAWQIEHNGGWHWEAVDIRTGEAPAPVDPAEGAPVEVDDRPSSLHTERTDGGDAGSATGTESPA